MNQTTNTMGAGSSANPDHDTDYRLREAEARLDRRIAAVESQRARTNLLALLSGAALVVTVAVLAFVLWTVPGKESWTVDSVATQELLLRDVDGITRGRLGMDPEGRSRLTLADRDGRERIGLTVLADGSPGVTINDPDGRPRAVLAYLPDGTTNLVLADAQGVSRAVFGLDPDGSTQALFSDRGGTIRTLVGVDPEGVPAVSVFEDDGGEED